MSKFRPYKHNMPQVELLLVLQPDLFWIIKWPSVSSAPGNVLITRVNNRQLVYGLGLGKF